MQETKVETLMVPISDYATVSEDATLYEAILALEEAQKSVGKESFKHRAILVLDQQGQVVGKLNLWDVIESLEPKYVDLRQPREPSRRSFGSDYLRSVWKTYDLWQEPLDAICAKIADISVKDTMHQPDASEYIAQDAHLGEAINQLIMGRYLSLLVIRDRKIVGILRLSDVFQEIYERAKACRS